MSKSKLTVLQAQRGTQLPCPLRYFSRGKDRALAKITLTGHSRPISSPLLQDQGKKRSKKLVFMLPRDFILVPPEGSVAITRWLWIRVFVSLGVVHMLK